MADGIITTVRDLRVQLLSDASRSEHVFMRTVQETPMPRDVVELSLIAHYGSFANSALAQVLKLVEDRDPEFAVQLMKAVTFMGANGFGECGDDVWPQVQEKLAKGGPGTPSWDEKTAQEQRK